MNDAQHLALVDLVRALVEEADDLRALAVCGSWARGDPRPDSDLDLLIVARDPGRRRRPAWLRALPFGDAGFRYAGHETATYGVVWSAHVALEPKAELGLTFAAPAWAGLDPVDAGTDFVVRDAFRVEVDKDGVLTCLVERLRA